MAISVAKWIGRPGLMAAIFGDLRLAVRLLREPAVPLLVKSLPFAAALYVVSPLDFIPDVLPGIGEIDDLVIVLLGVKALLRLSPAAVTAFHREAIAQGRAFSPMASRDVVIDVEFRPS